jgi:hypothetical protein
VPVRARVEGKEVGQLLSVELIMGVENMPNERLLAFYESVREQLDADRDSKYPFMGRTVREYAESLRGEITKRQLQCSPIVWPWDQD